MPSPTLPPPVGLPADRCREQEAAAQMEARPAVLLICLTVRSQASAAPLRLQIPPGTPSPQGSESTVRIRLSVISQPTGPDGSRVSRRLG